VTGLPEVTKLPRVTATVPAHRRTIDQILSDARGRLHRVGPERAAAAVRDGALLVDIRPQAQRAAEGEVPGALVVERNVLEWRFDPVSASRLPQATGHDVPVIIMCSEGYTSSLAAAALLDIGLHRATDVIGGYHALAGAGVLEHLAGGAIDRRPAGLTDAGAIGRRWI
jgi:rhodanese-related sulfurtransferase